VARAIMLSGCDHRNGFGFGSRDGVDVVVTGLGGDCALPDMWRSGDDDIDTRLAGLSAVASWPNVVWRM
jgi:hypothetical protein